MTGIKSIKNRIFGLALAALVVALPKVYAADCTSDGAYGETCVYDKNFEVQKKVRIQGDSEWKDKVINVPEGKIVEFRIIVKNVGEVEVDDMKMEDILPSEIEKTGGAGLTEYWEDFSVGESKTFIIQARIRSSEFKRSDSFEKCVVNKARAYYSDDLVGSDTATVCYGNKKITELPKTGATATEIMSLAGLVSTAAGIVIKRKSA